MDFPVALPARTRSFRSLAVDSGFLLVSRTLYLVRLGGLRCDSLIVHFPLMFNKLGLYIYGHLAYLDFVLLVENGIS